jgi:glutamyl-Q tRNA(Asp) synthetase
VASRVTRFAPSPTGYLHRGHAFSALTAATSATADGGRFLVRIEDIDQIRCDRQFEDAIFEDLAWLGLSWGVPVRRQSEHLEDYRRALTCLHDQSVLYRCFRTRAEILSQIEAAPHGPEANPTLGPHDPAAEAARLVSGAPCAGRLSLAAAARRLGGFDHLAFEAHGADEDGSVQLVKADPHRTGDIIVARKDLGVSYNLAVVVDDAAQGVTEVVRGEDLFPATHAQRLLQALLDLPTPAYRHHRLIRRPDGKRFAKRDTSETLRGLRLRGVRPDILKRDLGF